MFNPFWSELNSISSVEIWNTKYYNQLIHPTYMSTRFSWLVASTIIFWTWPSTDKGTIFATSSYVPVRSVLLTFLKFGFFKLFWMEKIAKSQNSNWFWVINIFSFISGKKCLSKPDQHMHLITADQYVFISLLGLWRTISNVY